MERERQRCGVLGQPAQAYNGKLRRVAAGSKRTVIVDQHGRDGGCFRVHAITTESGFGRSGGGVTSSKPWQQQ